MNRGRLMILKIFFLLTFLLCAGINTFSFQTIKTINTEITSCTCSDEVCICLDIDSLKEDQICHSPNTPSIQELYCQIPPFKGAFLIHSFYFTVWQPPKIS